MPSTRYEASWIVVFFLSCLLYTTHYYLRNNFTNYEEILLIGNTNTCHFGSLKKISLSIHDHFFFKNCHSSRCNKKARENLNFQTRTIFVRCIQNSSNVLCRGSSHLLDASGCISGRGETEQFVALAARFIRRCELHATTRMLRKHLVSLPRAPLWLPLWINSQAQVSFRYSILILISAFVDRHV